MEKITATLPQAMKDMIQGQEYVTDNIGKSGSAVLMFADKVLKIQPESAETKSEYEILKWLEGKLPVPKVLCSCHASGGKLPVAGTVGVTENGMWYLLMSRIRGDMACDEKYLSRPQVLAEALAESLKRLWEIDVTDCPCSWRLDDMLEAVTENVEKGLVDVEDAEPETFGENGFANPRALLEWLYANKPEEELVLSHGDFCLPNIFLEDGHLAGYIDLGKMGVADKWKDIALCYRSLKHNWSGKYAQKAYTDVSPDILFEALGIEPNWEKINYYILLDELM